MRMDMDFLRKLPLFKGIAREEFGALFACVNARRERYKKGDFIWIGGNETRSIGVILAGKVQIIKEDVFGNRTILNLLETGAVFGESFACGGIYTLTVSVLAATNCEILFLSFDRVMQMCKTACGYHNTLIRNMVEMLAQKNTRLMEKLEVTTKHSIREKMLTFLSQLVQEQGRKTVTSPMGRVDLADFLGVDRSALTRELNHMREMGLITFHKNEYTLHKAE